MAAMTAPAGPAPPANCPATTSASSSPSSSSAAAAAAAGGALTSGDGSATTIAPPGGAFGTSQATPPAPALLKSVLRRRSREADLACSNSSSPGPAPSPGPNDVTPPRRRSSDGLSRSSLAAPSPRLVRLATEPALIGAAAPRAPSRADQRALDLADAVRRLTLSQGSSPAPLSPLDPPPQGGLFPEDPTAAAAVDLRMMRFLQAAGAAPTVMTSLLQRRCTSMEQLFELPRDEWDTIVPDEAAGERLWLRVCKARRGSIASSHDGSRRASACPSRPSSDTSSSSEFEEATDW